jgi:hypothetical protein
MRSAVASALIFLSAPTFGSPVWSLTQNGESVTCATVFSPTSSLNDVGRAQAREWILGYLSGLNVASHANVGTRSDAEGMIGEVRLYCEGHPSMELIDAVDGTWSNLRGPRSRN